MYRLFEIPFIKRMAQKIGKYYWLKLLIKAILFTITITAFFSGGKAVIFAIINLANKTALPENSLFDANFTVGVAITAFLLTIFYFFWLRKKSGDDTDEEIIVFEGKNKRDKLRKLAHRVTILEMWTELFDHLYTEDDKVKYRQKLEKKWAKLTEKEKEEVRNKNREIKLENAQKTNGKLVK